MGPRHNSCRCIARRLRIASRVSRVQIVAVFVLFTFNSANTNINQGMVEQLGQAVCNGEIRLM